METTLRISTSMLDVCPGYNEPKIKYNPVKKGLTTILDGINFRPSDKHIPLGRDFVSLLGGTRPIGVSDYEQDIEVLLASIGTAPLKTALDYWDGMVTESAYKGLLENYDVANIEESHMWAAKKYGW